MKKLLFFVIPLLLVGSVAFTAKNVDANYADYGDFGVTPDFNHNGSDLSGKIHDFPPEVLFRRKYTKEDVPGNGTLSGTYAQFEDIADATSYLGFGYNVMESRYINKYDVLKTNPIFDYNQLKETNLLLDRENSFDSRFYKKTTMRDFSENYNMSLSIDGSYGPFFSGGLEADYEGSNSEKTFYSFYKGVINIKTFTLTMSEQNSNLRNMLASEFQSDLYNMAPASFFNKYGTHFLKDITMGGRLELNATYYSDSVNVTNNAHVAVNAHVSYMNYALGIEAEGGYSNTLSQEHVEETHNVFYVGGPQYPMTGPESVHTYLPQWVNSFNDLDNSSLVDVPNYQSLVPLWELVDPSNQARRNQLMNYFISAVQGSNNDLYNRFTTCDVVKLTVNKQGNGSVTGNNTLYKAGSTATATATPAVGYEFVGWYKNNSRVSTSPTYSFTIQANTTLVARFEQRMTMSGSGTNANPFIITSPAQFAEIRYGLSAYYKLGNNINFNNQIIEPIPGTFQGKLNGNNKELLNFKFDEYYTSGSTDYLGLFEYVGANGYIHDIKIKDSSINALQSQNNNTLVYAGLICGLNMGGRIENVDCYRTTVNVENKIGLAGTIAGYSKGIIRNCDLKGCKVYGSDLVGGITGSADADSLTENCTFDKDQGFWFWEVTEAHIKLVARSTGSSFVAGGIAGYCYGNGIIRSCSVKNTRFYVEGTLGNRQYPAMGYVVGHMSSGRVYYRAADIANNTKASSVSSSNNRYYFANYSGIVGRVENNYIVTTNY